MDDDGSKTMRNLPSSRPRGGKYRTKRRPNTTWGASCDIDQSGKGVPSTDELVDVYVAFKMKSKRKSNGATQSLKCEHKLSNSSIIPISNICDYCGDKFDSLSAHKKYSYCWRFIRVGKKYQADVETWSENKEKTSVIMESKMGDGNSMGKPAEVSVRALKKNDVEVILNCIKVGEEKWRKDKRVDWVASALQYLPHLSRSHIVSFFWEVYIQEHLYVEEDTALFPSYTPSSRKPYDILLPKNSQNGWYPWRKEDLPSTQGCHLISEVGSSDDRMHAKVYKLDTCYEIYALVPGLSYNEVHVRANSTGTVTICGEPEDPDSCWGVKFQKAINLPSRIDPHKISTVLDFKGLLLVQVPFEEVVDVQVDISDAGSAVNWVKANVKQSDTV